MVRVGNGHEDLIIVQPDAYIERIRYTDTDGDKEGQIWGQVIN